MKKSFYTILDATTSATWKCTLFLFIVFCGSSLAVQAQEIEQFGGDLKLVKETPINQAPRSTPEGLLVVDPLAVYSNVTTFSGSATPNGGSGTTSSNTTTRLIADDITLVGTPPFSIGAIRFNIANLNTVAVSARPRIRFYLADGVGGAPGTYITGFSYGAISYTAGNVATFTGFVSPFSVTSNNIWMAMIFDNNTGATGATIAQMDNLGMGIFTPPDVGSSTDNIFRTTANGGAGSFLVSNPVGATLNFTAAPVANLGFELIAASTINTLVRANPNPRVSGSSVSWTVTFNSAMSGLTAVNFGLINTGLTSPSITSVTPIGTAPTTQWTVTASTGSGVGTLGLNYISNTGANTTVTNTLPVVGEVYTISATIPVELTTFTARANQQATLLQWETASENNNKGFQIERQKANGDWETLGFVGAKGKAAMYNFTDKTPLATSYYRLRQIDNDGKETMSKVISISTKDNNKLKVYPNPVSNVLTIKVNTDDTTRENREGADYQVINLLGQQVMNGKATQRLDVSALPKGAYFLRVGTEQVKFVKQ
jgi:hypothetical protein